MVEQQDGLDAQLVQHETAMRGDDKLAAAAPCRNVPDELVEVREGKMVLGFLDYGVNS